MGGDSAKRVLETVDAVYRSGSRRVLATLICLLGDFDAAEEALRDAFAAAVEQWARDGEPQDAPLPEAVATGAEPFFIAGAMAGG
jgi:RNA polymerase sigma-70 factor (ECF subfamily)